MLRFFPLLLLVIFVSACGGQADFTGTARESNPSPVYGDTLVNGVGGEASTLLPILASDSASFSVAGHIYNGLVKYDKDLRIVGDLAESFTISPDGLTITFRLRKGVRWHDGAPFTARDVLYTYKVVVDPNTPTAYSESFKQVSSVIAPDPYTVVVKYPKPYAPALESWSMWVLPAHLLEKGDITKSSLSRNPVGTGPYKFKQWLAGQKIELQSNHDYFEGRPYIDRIVFRLIPDSSAMYMELKAGAIDQMPLSPVQYARQTNDSSFKSRYNKYRYPSNSYLYLGYNLRHPLFKDKVVRRAMTAAINKDELVQGVLFGMGQKAHGPIVPGRWAYNPNIKDLPFDPDLSRKLLAEAGWKPGSDGILHKDGRRFSFTILTNHGNLQRLMTAQIIQQRLRHVGIEVKIRVVEWAAFLNHFIDKGNFEAVMLAWGTGQDPDMYDVWHSSKTKPKELNFVGFANAEVDRLLEEGRSTFDVEKRKKAYFRIQEIMADEQPYTFLFVPDSLPAVSARIRGIEPSPAGIGHNMIKWFVPRSEQMYQ